MSNLELVKTVDERATLIHKNFCPDLNQMELIVFLNIAKTRGLDPLLNQIHAVKRAGKMVVQVGIDGLRALAARTKEYAGSDESIYEYDDKKKIQKATTTVYRMVQGQRCPFTASARWEEYYPGSKMGFMWDKLPETMLAKCSEAKALRKAFAYDLSGLYAEEELEQAIREVKDETNKKLEALNAKFVSEEKPPTPEYKPEAVEGETKEVENVRTE